MTNRSPCRKGLFAGVRMSENRGGSPGVRGSLPLVARPGGEAVADLRRGEALYVGARSFARALHVVLHKCATIGILFVRAKARPALGKREPLRRLVDSMKKTFATLEEALEYLEAVRNAARARERAR